MRISGRCEDKITTIVQSADLRKKKKKKIRLDRMTARFLKAIIISGRENEINFIMLQVYRNIVIFKFHTNRNFSTTDDIAWHKMLCQ